MKNIKDIILKHYKDKTPSKPKMEEGLSQSFLNETELHLTTLNIGLGDALILTSLTVPSNKNIDIYSSNRHWQNLCLFNDRLSKAPKMPSSKYIRTELLERYDLGGGHLSQRLQKTFGLNVQMVPKPFIKSLLPKKINKIGIHFSTGPSAYDLSRAGFKNPRQLSAESKNIIEEFIYNSNYEFYEFGQSKTFLNEKVIDCTNLSIEESLKKLSECEYFIGLNSGFMNAAAGLGIKSIIVVNVPNVENLYLPVLVDYGASDTNWLYPQNVHLFQNAENELIPALSLDNIKKAIDGKIYPFWDDEYLNLV
jgi:hypothetical protein